MLASIVNRDIKEVTQFVLEVVKIDLVNELKLQGHDLTGRLISEIEIVVKQRGDLTTGEILFLFYARFLELGVKRSNIPFSGRSGGRKSKYIEALIDYFEKRGLRSREAKSAAFATAHKHKREGMPTRASKRFSRVGTRTGFIGRTVKKNEKTILALVEKKASEKLSVSIDRGIRNILKAA